MNSILQINLHSEDEKAADPNQPKPENDKSLPEHISKKLNRVAQNAAHRAARDVTRFASKVFSK